MKYSDTTTKSGIIQTIEELCDLGDAYISGDTTRLRQFTARINRIANRVWHTIFSFTGMWEFDDNNQSDFPFASTDLVVGQRRYALPEEALTIRRVEILNESNDWFEITPLDKKQIPHGVDDFMEIDGDPMYYTLVGDVIELYPASKYAQDSSLRVYFDRALTEFAYNDTTKEPGFASPYHEILPIKTSIEWLKVKQPTSPTLQILLQDEARVEQNLKEFYTKRFKTKPPRITRTKVNYK
jgi:hypothetical protein